MPLPFRRFTLCKACLILLVITVIVGDFVSFYQATLTWDIPKGEEGSLRILAISDPQIQGYRGEWPGIIGYITRWDSDRFLRNGFYYAVNRVKPDIVVFLGDLFDEGYLATDQEFEEYQQRFKGIFPVPSDIRKIYLFGDNDAGGDGADVLTQHLVDRFSKFFGPINEVINVKSFQLIKINTVSFLRFSEPAYNDEKETYNETVQFIHGISSHIKEDTKSIVLAHAPLPDMPTDLYEELLAKVKPVVALSGHLHEYLPIYHRPRSSPVRFWEHVIPTCSYRMEAKKIGVGVLVTGPNEKPKIAILKLPDRYFVLLIYLIVFCVMFTMFVLTRTAIRRFIMSIVWTIIILPLTLLQKRTAGKTLFLLL